MNRTTHVPLLIAAGGLLAVAFILEAAMASVHFVSVWELHQHTTVPIVVHLIAYVSAIVSLSPAVAATVAALRRGRLHWKLIVIVAIAVSITAGWVMAGAGAAFLFLSASVLGPALTR